MIIKDCMKKDVISIHTTTTVREAARLVVERHVGLLPLVDDLGKLVGVVALRQLLSLELPDFVNLISDLDFIHDFGAVETTRPEAYQLDQPVSTLMEPAISVDEESGLLRAYALMQHHQLQDLPVVTNDGTLIGLASHVDIGAGILARWQDANPVQP
jgi:CBS domain-containing protein